MRQVATSSDKLQLVATSSDQLGRTLGQDLQDTLRGAWGRPEASDRHNPFSQGPGTLRAVSDAPGAFRKQRQAPGNDSKIIKIIEIIENAHIGLEIT